MKRLLALLALAVPVFAVEPQGFVVWKGSDLTKARDSRVLVVHREGNGEAEVHEKHAVFLVIESGEATLVAGGKLVDAKMAGPGEIRSASIQGGQSSKLSEGDVALIAANVPHQMLLAAGKQVTYLVIRQPVPEAVSEDATSVAPRPLGKKPALGIDLGSGFRSCVSGDDSPDGTVVDGYKKMTSRSFLGPSCLWASQRPQEKATTNSAAGDKNQARPGADVGEGYRSCVPGDNSPGGTIVDGYRKVVTSSPFGASCGWERIK